MRNPTAISVFMLFTHLMLSAQPTSYKGVLKDKISGAGLAYVNIGILNKNIGTVSDANGKFEIILDDKYAAETLKISMIGYKNSSYRVADFQRLIREDPVVYLEKNISELKEVVIKNKNLRPGILGNILDKKTVSAGFVNNVLGNEIGIIVKIKNRPTFIEAFNAIIDYNHYKELKFRINFYDLKNGLPNTTILQENIIVTSNVRKGKMCIDLSEYNIVVNNDFFVSIELIESLGEGGLHFLADYDGTPVITRAASQGKWNKQDDLSFGFNVSVKH